MKHRFFLCVVTLAGLSVSLMAQTPAFDIPKTVEQYDGYLKEVRRYLHVSPELGGYEKETVKYLKNELGSIGKFEIHDVPGSTGFYAILDTKRPGSTIGLRTDIDGLPITEKNVNGGGKAKPWVSKNVGVTHGCGHDGHMAILLTTARILWQWKDQLTGRYVFIFEEGEETNTGIRPMIAALKDIHFDAIYGNHLSSILPTGKLLVKEGPIMAGMATVALHVDGKGGHASRPDLAVSPIPAAAEIVTALGQAWVNQRNPTEAVTLGITQLEGGKVYNVIPNSVFVGGTLRFFNLEEGEKAVSIVKSVSENVAVAHQCTVRYDSVMTVNLPPVVNDTTLAVSAANVLDRLYPGHVTIDEKYIWWASETFALYSQLAPTLFLHVGIRNEEKGTTASHHTDNFDIDEDALAYGVGAMLAFATQVEVHADKNTTSQRLLLLPDFQTQQQTTNYTCGNVSTLMVLHHLGLDDETEQGLAQKMHTHVDSDTPRALPGTAVKLTDYGTNVEEVWRYFNGRKDISIIASSFQPDEAKRRTILTDTARVGIQDVGNIAPEFLNYQETGKFFIRQLKEGNPIMVCWASKRGHWTVVIGYDNHGTPENYEDDIVVMADPHDTYDGELDGITTVPLVQFFYHWYCIMTPKPWQLQPYVIVKRK